ncbi:MAG: hypothetical protein ACT6RN_19425 [Agrobacterium sp.]|uniref:hypothetical protein n=1 Tax=Agrobacterium sp. TaxID=361 RepID=UPI0040377195
MKPGGTSARVIQTSSRKSTLCARSVLTDAAGTPGRVVKPHSGETGLTHNTAATPSAVSADPAERIDCWSATVP